MALDSGSVFDAALALPREMRAELARQLVDSLQASEQPIAISPGWAAELDRRWNDYEEGRDPGIPIEDLFPELRLDESEETVTLSPAWIAEIERRLQEIDEGRCRTISAEEVFAALREKRPSTDMDR